MSVAAVSVAAVLVAAMLAWAPSARAQTLTPAEQEEAHGLFDAGRAAFSAGRYEDALGYFERSYTITGAPELLYNIAHTAERIRHDERALEAFEQYLEARPDSEERESIEARIANLRRAIAERAALRGAADDGAGEQGAGEQGADPDDADEGEPSEPTPDPEPSGGSPAGWIVLGAGGAVAISGAILLGLAAAAASDVSGASPGTPWSDVRDAYANADTFGIAGGVLLGVGALAMAAGLVWGIVELPNEQGATVDVAIGPGQVTLRGRF